MTRPRPWELDDGLAHIPMGFRHTAWCAAAVAAEHTLQIWLAMRWSVSGAGLCGLVVMDPDSGSSGLTPQRRAMQELGIALIHRIAQRTEAECLACGSTESPMPVALLAPGGWFDCRLCADCQAWASAHGHDYESVVSRFDPRRRGTH